MFEQTRQLALKILHLDDSPERIAWGIALGMFIAWTPTVGIQMIIAAIVAGLLRGNKAAAVAIVWISNPWTIVPIYWFNYQVGYLLVGGPIVDRQWFDVLRDPNAALSWIEQMGLAWGAIRQVYWPMFCGSMLVGTPVAVFSYLLTLSAVRHHRGHRRVPKGDDAPPAP